MYGAVMVVMVSGYTFCGIAAGGNLPYGPVLKPTLVAERWLASAPASGGRDRPLVGFDTCKAPSLPTMRVWPGRLSRARGLPSSAAQARAPAPPSPPPPA